MKVPGAADVNKSLVALKKSLKACEQLVNQQAGRLLSNGDYARAESLVEVAKSVSALRSEAETMRNRWREIRSSSQEVPKAEQTPLWKYYQPILQALVELGGTTRIADLEAAVGQMMRDRFKEGDLTTMARGKRRWQLMIRRARRHLAKEGLVEKDTGAEWRITPMGHDAAKTGQTGRD